MNKIFKDFLQNERGATSIEYALIIVVVGIGIIASLQSVGVALDDILSGVAGYVQSAI